jgi:formylglycine-generating enzyme required for sulfatase activity
MAYNKLSQFFIQISGLVRISMYRIVSYRLKSAPGLNLLGCSLLILLTSFTSVAKSEELGVVDKKPPAGRYVETPQGYMVPYQQEIPGTGQSFHMVPIPGGTFLLGSPESEIGRNTDEGPQVKVTIAPFWMSQHEVTWAQYQSFMGLYSQLKQIQGLRYRLSDQAESKKLQAQLKALGAEDLLKHLQRLPEDVDAITAPTELYEPDITYEYGSDADQPAVTMTQYAAKQYSKWVSKLTGFFYALPSEAEWEYAARAGAKTAYHFGDDAAQLGEYAWYAENADSQLHKVGTKKPNRWGLYDMHGNVAEWVLDGYDPGGFTPDGQTRWSTEVFPRVIRGGSWESTAAACRNSARLASDDEAWKEEDPNLPKSPWWLTTDPARGVGFRLIRPLAPPSDEEKKKYWEIDAEEIGWDVEDRLEEGRGVKDNIHSGLPEVLQQLKKIDQ